MDAIKDFIHRNPVRVASLVTALVALAVDHFHADLPVDTIVFIVLSALGLGEYAQRVENSKTVGALYTDPDEAE